MSKSIWLLPAVCGVLCVFSAALAGCGSDSSSAAAGGGAAGAGGAGGAVGSGGGGGGAASPGPDRSADFAINIDPASKNAIVKPGQTVPVTLDLLSINGFQNAINLAVGKIPAGWTATFATPTVSSLPKGTTKVTLNVTAPAGAPTGTVLGSFQVSATGGGVTRYLNGGGIYDPASGGSLSIGVAGISLHTFAVGETPFNVPFALVTNDLSGSVSIQGIGLTGPVTVALTNNNAGLTATLVQSTFTPIDGAIGSNVQIKLHVDPTVVGGAYPFTLTATAPDGTSATSTFNLYVKSVAFVGASFPELFINGAVGSTGSVGADVKITGVPTAVVQLTIPNPPANIGLNVAPTSVTIPASGTITQHVTLQGQMLLKTSPTAYGIDLTGTFPDTSSQSTSFIIRVL
jgi:hypothetical protein